LRLIEALAEGDGKTVVGIADTLRTHALNAAATLEEMCSVLQRMAVIQAVPAAASAGDEDATAIARLAALMPPDETQLLYSLCLHGRTELGLAPDEYAAFTMVLLRLLAFQAPRSAAEKKSLNEAAPPAARTAVQQPASAGQARPVAAASAATSRCDDAPSVAPTAPPGRVLPVVESRADRIPQRPAAAANDRPHSEVVGVPVHVPPESARDAPARAPQVVPTADGDFWQATVADLVACDAVTALVRELALQSQLVARDEGHWMLRVERESLNQPASRERLKQALHGAGHCVTLSVEVGPVTDSPARRLSAAQAQRQRAAEEAIHNDPFVQAMMREFGARIVPGSIKPVSHS
ncbi:MAG TPA: DNA polymerase III subunit gamma/tau C-terminal domain-containing protein, partial [Ramlibacter sp.]|nr:DNA polymerase III subunit gamma/tau C-terminal domain-containing protein [Ramlibacter sp.]